ncbi:hypothetical protein LA52FAK_41620 [Desulforhopalus sp. 52FAK]
MSIFNYTLPSCLDYSYIQTSSTPLQNALLSFRITTSPHEAADKGFLSHFLLNFFVASPMKRMTK